MRKLSKKAESLIKSFAKELLDKTDSIEYEELRLTLLTELVRELQSKGFKKRIEIARKLTVSENTVNRHMKRAGTYKATNASQAQLSREQIDYIEQVWGEKPTKLIAYELGTSYGVVYRIGYKLGLHKKVQENE